MGTVVYDDLLAYKVPATVQAGPRLSGTPDAVLVSKAGETSGPVSMARSNEKNHLVDVPAALGRQVP